MDASYSLIVAVERMSTAFIAVELLQLHTTALCAYMSYMLFVGLLMEMKDIKKTREILQMSTNVHGVENNHNPNIKILSYNLFIN